MNPKIIHLCPLCGRDVACNVSTTPIFYQNKTQLYYQCRNCCGIFATPESRPDRETELARYQEHNNDVEDAGYQKFVSPITAAVIKDFTPNSNGLDFGAGTGPVISKLLNDQKFQIVQYDPFFHNYPDLLEKKYDYIACCEVIEHFYNPSKEFNLLKKLLLPKGKLYCMTDIYDETINFEKWYYKNDPTHVFIYHKTTINWIKEKFGFSNVSIDGRLITYSN